MLEQQISTSQSSQSRTAHRTWRLALLAAILLLVALIVFKGVTLSLAAWDAYRSAMQLRAMLAVSPLLSNMSAIQETVGELESAYDGLAGELQPLLPATALLRSVPDYGPLAAAAPALLPVGDQGMALLRKGVDLAAPHIAELRAAQPDASIVDLLPQVAARVGPELPVLAEDLASLKTSLAAVDTSGMPDRAVALLQGAPGALALAEVVTRLGPELPALLGMDGPKHYLVLVQNNHELRATGGFIAAIGKITLDQGKLVELDFVDSYDIYRNDGVYPPAPTPMKTHMNIPLMLMRDANWSPDLPTAARVASTLYRSDTGVEVDGIVTVDLDAVRTIFGALGEVQVPGFDELLTGDNIESQVVRLWERPAEGDTAVGGATPEELGAWWEQRKDFIPALTQAALAHVQNGGANYLALADALHTALAERSVQAWLVNPAAEEVLSAAEWDGGLHPEEGKDYLAVIDTNMGYNKADAAIERALDYRVAWPDGPDAPAQATLTLTYTHPIDADDPGCDLTPRYGNSYADLIARCYFNYIRVYVPLGSKLIEATGVTTDSVSTQRGEKGTQVFTGYFILPPRNTNVATFTYTLPPEWTPENYALVLQRQSGTGPLPVTLEIDGAAMTTTLDGAKLAWPLPASASP